MSSDSDVSSNDSRLSNAWRSTKRGVKKAKRNIQQKWHSVVGRWPAHRRDPTAASSTPDWQNVDSANQPYYPVTKHSPQVTAPSSNTEGSIRDYAATINEQKSSIRSYESPKAANQSRITFSEDNEDLGIMSEAETASTGGTFGRRQVRSKPANFARMRPSPTIGNSNINYSSGSISQLTPAATEQSPVGLIFLNYQGETKRAHMPDDVRSLDDIRNMFYKAFSDVVDLDYIHSTRVKIYVQDPARQDVFYELEDLRDVKDRTVLKLHEQVRPLTPAIDPATGRAVYDLANSSQPSTTSGRVESTDEMNYFSEPELDSPYRSLKNVTSTYASPSAQQTSFQRRYGTLDAYYRSSDRTKYNTGGGNTGGGPPAKPQRFIPSTINSPRTNYNQRSTLAPFTSRYGSSGESEVESYMSMGYGGGNQSDIYGAPDRSLAPRSGSVTPVIDEEARARMMNMEKQLANLSSLVHSALAAKGMSDTVYKDIEMLRREILGPHSNSNRDDASDSGSVSRFSDISSDKGSFIINERDGPVAKTSHHPQPLSPQDSDIYSLGVDNGNRLTPEAKQLLRNMKKKTSDIQVEVKHLRRMAQVNAQSARDVLKDAFDRIRVILNTNQHLHIFAARAQQQNVVDDNPLLSDRSWVNQEQERYCNVMRNLEQEINSFEKQVEDTRHRVINGDRKLRLSEVEHFTELLTNISKNAANLKTQFPHLQERIKNVMSVEMEKVVREEKFIKDEPFRLDNALKRCRKLTNTMVTMKKLALIQDPNAYRNAEQQRSHSTTPMSEQNATSALTKQTFSANAPNFHSQNPIRKTSPPREPVSSSAVVPKPILQNSAAKESSKVLDSLLEELQSVAKSTNPYEKQNGGEKRVGFVEEVERIIINDKEPGDSDTIKRSPKTSLVPASPPINNTSLVNNNSYSEKQQERSKNNGYDENMNLAKPKRVELPVYSKVYNNRNVSHYIDDFPSRMSPQLNSNSDTYTNRGGDRSHSSTPLSIASEPANFDRYQPAPPPPPRSSSRTLVNNTSLSSYQNNFKSSEVDELKHQLTRLNGAAIYSTPANINRSSLAAPPMVQTNAVDNDDSLSGRGIKSASSSESVNSQEAMSLDGRSSFSNKPPPPPPPPRNRQEMLEQRQHELMNKQRRYPVQYTKLQDTKRPASNGNIQQKQPSQFI